MQIIAMVLHLLPDFEQFLEVQYLSHGYNIPWDMLIQHFFSVLFRLDHDAVLRQSEGLPHLQQSGGET